MKQNVVQGPCTEVFPPKSKIPSTKGQRAVFLNENILKPGYNGNVTITFGTNGCSGCSTAAAWSYIGTQSNTLTPSMNLGWIDPPFESFTVDGVTVPLSAFKSETRNYCPVGATNVSQCSAGWQPGATVIHEFGHSLGLLHEQQSMVIPGSNPIVLNTNNVLAYYINLYHDTTLGTQAAHTNVIDTYKCDDPSAVCKYSGSEYDKKSIMLYRLPDNWLVDPSNNPTQANFTLSPLDIQWLQKYYPPGQANPPHVTVKFLDGPDWKRYWVKYVITTMLSPLISVQFSWVGMPATPTGTPSVTTPATPSVTSTPSSTTVAPHITNIPTTTPRVTNTPIPSITTIPTISPTMPTLGNFIQFFSSNILGNCVFPKFKQAGGTVSALSNSMLYIAGNYVSKNYNASPMNTPTFLLLHGNTPRSVFERIFSVLESTACDMVYVYKVTGHNPSNLVGDDIHLEFKKYSDYTGYDKTGNYYCNTSYCTNTQLWTLIKNNPPILTGSVCATVPAQTKEAFTIPAATVTPTMVPITSSAPPIKPTTMPVVTPTPSVPRQAWFGASEQQQYPRPQGNLPMGTWGLTDKTQARNDVLYKGAMDSTAGW